MIETVLREISKLKLVNLDPYSFSFVFQLIRTVFWALYSVTCCYKRDYSQTSKKYQFAEKLVKFKLILYLRTTNEKNSSTSNQSGYRKHEIKVPISS